MLKRLFILLNVVVQLLPVSTQAGYVRVKELPQVDRAAIRQVIKAQIAAFQKDDANLAFSYASPLIQYKFGSAENFVNMVKTAYPSVYRPRDVQFRELKMTFDGPVQTVFFFGPSGDAVLGLYLMQKQKDGNWKTNGCELTPAPDKAI